MLILKANKWSKVIKVKIIKKNNEKVLFFKRCSDVFTFTASHLYVYNISPKILDFLSANNLRLDKLFTDFLFNYL